MTTTTVQTGADQAAAELAERLRATGWDVRVSGHDGERYTFEDGRLMIPVLRNVFVHANGPRSIGHPYLVAQWATVTAESREPLPGGHLGDTKFCPADITFYGADLRVLATEAELATWLDALTAVATALDA